MTFSPRHFLFRKSALSGWIAVMIAILYALLFAQLSGGGLDRLYSRSPYHRLQAQAMLHGQFGLADSLYQINLDLAWHNGQIHQVWGLGVGLWLMPFEALYHLLGKEAFPDRLALDLAVFLYALYSITAAMRIGRDFKNKGIGFVLGWLLLFFPPFWILSLAPQLVYEETVLYGCLISQFVLVALVRFILYRRPADYLICCILGGLTGLIRPTHLIYGFGGAALCTLLLLEGRRNPLRRSPKLKIIDAKTRRLALLGISCLAASLLFLAWSNKVRFGSATEFGHSFTATGGVNLFFSRFSQPYGWHDIPALAKELVGWLFFPAKLGQPNYYDNLVYFQAPVPRWRDVYFPNFNLGYLLLILVGTIWGLAFLIRRLRARGLNALVQQRLSRGVSAVMVWSLVSLVGLFIFYIPLTSISSRYIMDLSPAILGGVLVVAVLFYRRWPFFTLLFVITAVGADLSRVRQDPIINQPTTVPYIRSLAPSMGATIDEFHGLYDREAHPLQTELRFNGYGWTQDGLAGPIVILAVDAPKFIELTVRPPLPPKKNPDKYRARIGKYDLPLVSSTNTNRSIVVHFEVPEVIRQRAGDELVSLCFIENLQPQQRDSRRILESVRWR